MAKGKAAGKASEETVSAPKTKFSIRSMINAAKNEYIYPKGDIRAKTDFIDTGSYPLNAIFSGSVKKGLPDNRTVMFAGEPATGKTFFTLRICKSASNAGYFVVYFDTEGEKDEEIFTNFGFKGRGEDYEFLKVKTIEDLRTQMYGMIEKYKEYFRALVPGSDDYNNRTKLLFVVDSISFLTSESEATNLAKGEPKQNLQLNKQLKAFFRDVTIDLNICKCPLIIVNHVYDLMEKTANTATIDAGKKVSGGSGGAYGASAIILLKTKESRTATNIYSEKDAGNVKKEIVTGNFFTCKAIKSRYIRKGSEVDIYVDFKTGIAKNFGLQRFCEGTLVEPVSHGSKGKYYKLICKPKNENGEYPEVKSYLAEIPNLIDEIDEIVKKTFQFGNETDENGELIGISVDGEPSEPNEEDFAID
jgi:RecA/RadA recombinase